MDGTNTTHFPLIFPGVTHARNCLTDNDLTYRCSARWLQEGGIAASNVCLQALFVLSLPFPCYFFPKQRAWARSIQTKFQPVRPGKEDHLKRWTRKLFRLDRTDPLSFRPKFPESLVEWIAPPVHYGWPFVSKLWHDIHAVFSDVYLQLFLLHDIRAFYSQVYDHFLTNAHIYAHKKSHIYALQTSIYNIARKFA